MIKINLAMGAATAALLVGSGAWAGEGVRLAGGPCGADADACPCPAPVDLPPARPGQCFAKVHIAPVFESVTTQVVAVPARREARVTPAVYEDYDRQVLVSPERVERVVIPAVWRTVVETVVDRPAGVRVEETPPQWGVVVDTVLVRPSHTEWRRSFVGPDGVVPNGAQLEATGEIVCLVEIPAVYDRVERRVMVRPGERVEIPVPALTHQAARQVLDTPEQVVERRIPAVWRTERARRMISPERTDYVDIPAVTRSVTQQRLVSPASESWRPIDCPQAVEPPAFAAPPVPDEHRGAPPRLNDGERG